MFYIWFLVFFKCNDTNYKSNREIEKILENENTVKYIKLCRTRWLGHGEIMDEERIPKRVMNGRMEEWREPGDKYVKEADGQTKLRKINGWIRIVLEAKSHHGL